MITKIKINVLMIKQILPANTKRNIWTTLRRICMLILELHYPDQYLETNTGNQLSPPISVLCNSGCLSQLPFNPNSGNSFSNMHLYVSFSPPPPPLLSPAFWWPSKSSVCVASLLSPFETHGQSTTHPLLFTVVRLNLDIEAYRVKKLGGD